MKSAFLFLARRSSLALVVMFVCLGVFMQMLGVPVTLLNTSLVPDVLEASVLEGFTIPSTLPNLALFPNSGSADLVTLSMHLLLLASSLFHPPIL